MYGNAMVHCVFWAVLLTVRGIEAAKAFPRKAKISYMGQGIACMAARGRTEFVDVLLVSNTAVLKQVGYGLQFNTISEAAITAPMGKSRKVALNASHVASAGPRDLIGAPS